MKIKFETTIEDIALIQNAIAGDKNSLEDLIKKYQDWIFNISLSFTADRHEAADLTQEVLIKIITKLSNFRLESNFKTWIYRIAKNHFLNTKRKNQAFEGMSFDAFGKGLDSIPDEALSNYSFEVEEKLLVEEAKLSCMKGMLLCLDPEQRLIFILGDLFEFPDTIGSEIMEMTKQNFRVKLHRARQQLYNFMQSKCGLINKQNPCRCARKTAGYIKRGFVDPKTLHFQRDTIKRIDQVIEKKLDSYEEVFTDYQKLYQEHPFLQSPESLESIKQLLSSKKIQETFDFTD